MSSHTYVSISPKKQVLDNDYSKTGTKANTRRFKVTLFVLSLFLIIFATIILTLALTIFKPKDPYISVSPIGLEKFDIFQPNSTNVPLDLVITIGNPNYGAFKYINSTGYINYNDTVVGEVPLVTNLVPGRSKINVSTYAGVMTHKLINDPKFVTDIGTGGFNCTAKATLPGKVILLKIFKLKATVYIACDIFFKLSISSMGADSSCISKIKL